jgi:hypothetical protein
MSIIYANNKQKAFHARYGYNPIFGMDVDKRERLTDSQAVDLFDSVWEKALRAAIENAETCMLEHAQHKLKNNEKSFLDSKQEQREFVLKDGVFIAQLREQRDSMELEVTQLWFVRSSNPDPRTLYVRFDTQSQRERFREFAKSKGFHEDRDLGKLLLMHLMDNPDETAWLEILAEVNKLKRT